MTSKSDDRITPSQLARVAPCDWNAEMDRYRGVLDRMTEDERREFVELQSREVICRRAARVFDSTTTEIEAEIASLQNEDAMTIRWQAGGSLEWPGIWPLES